MSKHHVGRIPANPGYEKIVEYVPDIVFSSKHGRDLKLQLLKPWRELKTGYPLIVFIQGSAWTSPNAYYQIPQLSYFAQNNYVVASVEHRSCYEAQSPAFLQDVKTAIRFLRAHADKYNIDASQVCAFGTSSGGNTALLLGLTGDDKKYNTDEWAEHPSHVQCVVDCFGPTDIPRMLKEQYADYPDDGTSVLHHLAGGDILKNMRTLEEISPALLLDGIFTKTPMLLLHGDADDVVLFEHTLDFYKQITYRGFDAEMYNIPDAPHEGSFWSAQLLEIVLDFLNARMAKQ